MRERRFGRTLRVILPLVGGLGAGTVGAKVMEHRSFVHTAFSGGANEASGGKRDDREVRRLAESDAREGRRSEAADGAPMNVGPLVSRSQSPQERERRVEDLYSAFEVRVSKHRAAPRYPKWSSKMEHTIDASLKEILPLPGTSVKYEGVDCRTSTCLARVAWPSRATAIAELRTLSVIFAPSNCSIDIALPPGSERVGPLTASVLLTCREPI